MFFFLTKEEKKHIAWTLQFASSEFAFLIN